MYVPATFCVSSIVTRSAVGGSGADVAERRVGVLFDREVAEGHDADRTATVDDGKAAERAFAHQLHRVLHAAVGAHRGEVTRAGAVDRRVGGRTVGKAAHHEV